MTIFYTCISSITYPVPTVAHSGGLVLAVRSGGSLGRLLAAFPGLFSYIVAIE